MQPRAQHEDDTRTEPGGPRTRPAPGRHARVDAESVRAQMAARIEEEIEEQLQDAAPDKPADDEPMPSFSEQMSQQLGGVRGLIESSIPVLLFVIMNLLGDHFKWWSLRTSLIVSVASALALALYRLSRKEAVRHAINGVFGVAIGAFIAYRSGNAGDFYLPGIILSAVYAVAMLISVAFRMPLVGWVWSVMADGGSTRWRDNPVLVRAFGWLTVLWAAVYAGKTGIQYAFYLAHHNDLLGVARLVLGWPPYILLAAFTVWRVRRILNPDPGANSNPTHADPGHADSGPGRADSGVRRADAGSDSKPRHSAG